MMPAKDSCRGKARLGQGTPRREEKRGGPLFSVWLSGDRIAHTKSWPLLNKKWNLETKSGLPDFFGELNMNRLNTNFDMERSKK